MDDVIKRCRIVKLHKKEIGSVKVISAMLADDENNEYEISWAAGPCMDESMKEMFKKEFADFTNAWEKAQEGLIVELHYSDDCMYNYFLVE